MSNVRAIKSRAKSIISTQQITKAMKMVAASKLRKVETLLEPMRSFKEASARLLDTVLIDDGSLNNVLAQRREIIKKVCYVVFVGNRGLCGSYNSTIYKYLQDIVEKETREYEIVVCGNWGRDAFEGSGMNVYCYFTDFSDAPSPSEVLDLAYFLRDRYSDGTVDQVNLVYTMYLSALNQQPTVKELLPVRTQKEDNEKKQGRESIICIPDKTSVFDSVISLCVNNRVYYTMLEAKCAEHSSRMVAMTAASDSTKTLIAKLNLELNRARQSQVTTQINEIVGGAAALKKK